MPDIYTVIVTFNGEKWIENCLNSLLNSSINTRVVVVDNGSTDKSIEILKNYEDKITLILSEENLGFGGGNNIGIRAAAESGAEYIFLLNQDAYVEKDTIEKLLNFSASNKFYGIISPMQMAPGGAGPDPLFKKYFSSELLNNKADIIPVRFVNAAAWFIPFRVFKQCGLFHPVFFHYGEDNNFCSRVQYHGYKAGILKTASVIHDREVGSDEEKKLLQQIRTVPLYTLLDIRKPRLLAWMLGYLKLQRLKSKLDSVSTDLQKLNLLYSDQKKWFNSRFAESGKIRRETKEGLPDLKIPGNGR